MAKSRDLERLKQLFELAQSYRVWPVRHVTNVRNTHCQFVGCCPTAERVICSAPDVVEALSFPNIHKGQRDAFKDVARPFN